MKRNKKGQDDWSRMSKVKRENLGQVTEVLSASHNFEF